MLTSSQDILFYVLALCAIVLTAFIAWLLYYFIAIIKNVYNLTQLLKGKLETVDEILKLIKNHLSSAASYVGLIANGVDKLVNYLQQKKKTSLNNKTANKKTIRKK